MFVHMISHDMSLKLGNEGSITKSPALIIGKSCEHSEGHIFVHIVMKLAKNVCPDDPLNNFQTWSH